MRTRPDHWYKQSAAIPVREVDGKLEVLLVTSLANARWILPKGIVEPGMTPFGSAAKEAWEEAGVKGEIQERPTGGYISRKWGGVCKVEAFRLDVTHISEDWLESGKRKRKWFPIDDAVKALKAGEAAEVVKKLGMPGLRLTLLRHAKSSWDDHSLLDIDRPLSKRGRRDAPLMAKRYAEISPAPEAVYFSPAVRSAKTAKIFAEALHIPKKALEERAEIYEAEMTELLALVRDLPPEIRHAMVVGHNPGLSELLKVLAREPVEDLPTTGYALLELTGHDWKSIEPKSARVILLDFPKNAQV